VTGHLSHWYVNRVRQAPTRRCVGCHRALVWVDEVGWVDAAPGASYDLCDADAFGNHLPGPLGPTGSVDSFS
jgi:hypothetical protein